jgi:Predicted dioxygenase
LSLMDGSRDIFEIANEYKNITEQEISPTEVLAFVEKLNNWYLLDNENFRKRYSEITEEFLNFKIRPMVFAGEAYPESAEDLLNMVASAKRMESLILAKPKGVVIPHIDPRRGWEVYLEGLRALYRSSADTFVVFGIAHSYISNPINALIMDIETPLGVLQTDKESLERLNSILDFDLFSDPIAFRNEHSIEFPSVFIKALFPEREIKVLPFIFLADDPEDYEKIEDFVDALSKVLEGKDFVIIASVDMSHVGVRFGDNGIDEENLRFSDRLFLEILESLEAESLLSWYKMYQNPTRIDALPAVYALMKFFGGKAKCKVLSYKISYEEETNSAVSFASAIIF